MTDNNMSKDEQEVKGIIISTAPQGEYGRRVRLLTDKLGKITAFAGGAAKVNSKLIGTLRPMTSAKFRLSEGRGAYNIHGTEVMDAFDDLAFDFETSVYAMYVLEAGKCIVPLVELIIIIGIRCFAIGKAIPAGTGGTEVTETFGIKQAIGFCFDQVRYIFGINAGPEYLNGLTWEDTPSYIRKLVYIGIVLICAVVCIYVFDLMRKHSRSALRRALETALLFGGFIALCIGCSSVTIRLEMRWVYVSFAAALLYASYMTGSLSQEQEQAQSHIQECERIITIDEECSKSQGVSPARSRGCGEQGGCHGGTKGTIKPLAVTLFTAYALVTIYVNIFYRGYFTRIYLWPNQLRMNSLAEQTVEKYGIDGILGKDIYILGNSYEMSEFYADTFFKTFDPKMKAEGTEVIFIDSIEDADFEGIENGEALVLKELPEDNAYLDITKEVLSHFQSEPSGNTD